MGWNRATKFLFWSAVSIYLAFSFGFDNVWTKRIDSVLDYFMGKEPGFLTAEELDDLVADYGVWCFKDSFAASCTWLEAHTSAPNQAISTQLHAVMPSRSFGETSDGFKVGYASVELRRVDDMICGDLNIGGNVRVYERKRPRTLVDLSSARDASPEEADDFRFSLRRPNETGLCFKVSGYGVPLLLTEYRMHPVRDGETSDLYFKFFASSPGGLHDLAIP